MRNPLASEHERVAAVLFYGIVLLLGFLFYRIVAPFLTALGWAAVLAIFVHPWHERLVDRYGRVRAAIASTAVVTLLLLGPGLVILMAFVQESQAALATVDRDVLAGQLAVIEQAWTRIRVVIPGAQAVDLQALVEETISRAGGFLAARVGGLLANVVVLLFQLFVTLFALFFFLRDGDRIMQLVRRLLPFEEPRRERMIRLTRDLVYTSIAAGVVIASLQGLAGGLLFALLGLAAPVFWGVMMGFFALLPLVGTWLVWGPAAIWLIAAGQPIKGLVLAGLGLTIVGSIDNFVRPAIMSGRARMNGLLMFISLIGGVNVFGLLGIVLGPLVTAIVSGLFEAYAGPDEIVGTKLAPKPPTTVRQGGKRGDASRP